MGIEVKVYSEKVLAALESAERRALTNVGSRAVTLAREELSRPKEHKHGEIRPNVITGNLRKSIRKEVVMAGEKAVYIGTDVEYAGHVELGSAVTWAYPYLRPAALYHTDEYKKIVEAAFSGETD